jgi:deoxyinosine 3'endonuclease (endonuclease V)
MGIAAHLGVLLDRLTIGCAKSLLIGTREPLAQKAGSWTALVDANANDEHIGAAVRTRKASSRSSSREATALALLPPSGGPCG